MQLCKSRQIQNCCQPNALMTLEEFLMDYASDSTKKIGQQLIEAEIKNIPSPKMRTYALQSLEQICAGKRDFFV